MTASGETPLRRVLAKLRRLPRMLGRSAAPTRLYDHLVRNALAEYPAHEFTDIATTPAPHGDVKLFAYYLPQFHPIPENDEWWGRGFTEWRNVARAFPIFEGHYQPRSPGELGYYDLRIPDVMRRQVELARLYGLAGFCFHFYWFGGKRLLELPLQNFLANPGLDLGFSLCWANENWTRRWTGNERDVLIAQNYSAEDDVAFIRYVDRYFRDPRYHRIEGKPVLTIYRPSLFPDMAATVERWRREAEALGYPGIYLIATNAFDYADHGAHGFDALSEFPPHGVAAPNIENRLRMSPHRDGGRVRGYADVVERMVRRPQASGVVHPGVMPGWDNSPRRPTSSVIYHDATPADFRRWLDDAITRARRHEPEERIVYINAWNEWAEGAYLEPDRRFGYGYLAACAQSLADA